MKKILALMMCAVLALSACGEKETAENANQKPVVKIGVTLPLTGNIAQAGKSAQAALEMMLEDISKKDLRYDYQLIFEDNQMNGVKTATTTNKLIDVDKVRAVFTQWVTSSNVVSSITKARNVIGMFCAFGRKSNDGKYNFNAHASYDSQAEAVVRELKKRNIKTVALFIDNSDVREQYDVLIRKLKEQSNIEIVFKEYFNIGERDYRTAISKAAEQNPDIYFISGFSPSPFLFLKQLKEITGRNDNVTAIDILNEIDASVREIANGLWYVSSNVHGLQKFQDDLNARKGVDSQGCSGNLAANLQILVDAFENAPLKLGQTTPDNEAIRTWIFENVKNYPTISGNLTVLEDGFLNTSVSVKKIINGKPVIIEE